MDGTKLSEDYMLYRTEMINRQVSLANLMESAKTLAEIYRYRESIPNDVVKLKDKKLVEIVEFLEQLSTRIEFIINQDAPEYIELKKDPYFNKL